MMFCCVCVSCFLLSSIFRNLTVSLLPLSLYNMDDKVHARIQGVGWGQGVRTTLKNHAIIRPPAKRHFNGVSLADRWWPA